MDCICKYDPERDIAEVNDYGFVDIVKANQTSTIDAPLALQEKQFNGIEDPRSIGDRPSDEFEMIQANHVILGYKEPASEASEKDATS